MRLRKTPILWTLLFALAIYATLKPPFPKLTHLHWQIISTAIGGATIGLAMIFSRGRSLLATLLVTLVLLPTLIPALPYKPSPLFLPLSFIIITFLPEKRIFCRFQIFYVLLLGELYYLLSTAYVPPTPVSEFFASLASYHISPFVLLTSAHLTAIAVLFFHIRKDHGADTSLLATLVVWILLTYPSHIPNLTNVNFLTPQTAAIPFIFLLVGVIITLHGITFKDPLTNIKGRRALYGHLESLTGTYTLAMIDIDFFKKFNDHFGHDAGDEVLQIVAKYLQHTARAVAYRFGGEEFVLIFNNQTVSETFAIVDGMRNVIEENPYVARKKNTPRMQEKTGKMYKEQKVKITVSIGLADSKKHGQNYEIVLKAADKNLYKAKKKGRNCVVM